MLAAIWIRGTIKTSPQIKKTLEILGFKKKNNLIIVPEDKKNMLKKVESYITYGEINKETLLKVIKKKEKTDNPEELVDKILKGEKKIVFNLRPPSKGFERKGIKKYFKEGGALGYRGNNINTLISRMI